MLTDRHEAAMQRVMRASRELRDAQIELARLTDPDEQELAAFMAHERDGPRLRLLDGGLTTLERAS
jgi:hypothetical protein